MKGKLYRGSSAGISWTIVTIIIVINIISSSPNNVVVHFSR